MILSAIMVVLVAIGCFWLCRNNKSSYIINFYLLTLALLTITAVMYASKIGQYTYSIQLDNSLYKLFMSLKINIIYLARIYNIAFGAFMFSSVIFVKKLIKIKWQIAVMLTLPIILFIIYNDYRVSSDIFFYMYSSGGAESYTQVLNIIKILNEVILIFYTFMPFAVLAFLYFRSEIFLSRKYYLIYFACLLMINIYFYVIFIFFTFSGIMPNNVDYIKLPVSGYLSVRGGETSIFLFSVTTLIVVFMTRLKNYSRVIPPASKKKEEYDRMLNENIGMVIHTYKNSYLALRRQLKMIKMYNGSERAEVERHAEICEEIVDEQLNNIAGTLKNLRDVSRPSELVDVVGCVSDAVRYANIPDDVSVVRSFDAPVVFVPGNRKHITEMFINIINNAVEAIERAGRQDGRIEISVCYEYDFCEIDFKDNGCGIRKNEQKKIFQLFYSTKTRTKSGGVGLNYVEKTVKSHGGDIKVESIESEGTNIRIALPLCLNDYLHKLTDVS